MTPEQKEMAETSKKAGRLVAAFSKKAVARLQSEFQFPLSELELEIICNVAVLTFCSDKYQKENIPTPELDSITHAASEKLEPLLLKYSTGLITYIGDIFISYFKGFLLYADRNSAEQDEQTSGNE